VLLSFTALLIAGWILAGKVPVSLLPDIAVPKIMIRVSYPNTPAAALEQNALRVIRESLAELDHLKNIESRAASHTGLIYLFFDHGTRMDLAYVEVNEKLDRLANALPADMERPQVMRINTADIPVIRLQVIPKDGSSYLEVSALAAHILKKRLEQIDGVSLVDINGQQTEVITVTPDEEKLAALGLDNAAVIQAIRGANSYLGNLSVKDGQYRYFVKLSNTLHVVNDIAKLPVSTKGGAIIALQEVARVELEAAAPMGYHLYNGREGLVITVQKQPGSRMNELVPKVKAAFEQFSKDYPNIDFAWTRDQTFLLDAGIDNLTQDLIYGGIMTVALLFMFLGNWATPTLMSISIPLSLIITFIFFYLFGISFNIISLSGLALGIGMLIDNSIVVVDSINRKGREGLSMADSSVAGTNAVMAPVISQVLTTVAVYAPLVLLSGMAGALVADQSIALTISLGVSLLVAFMLVPLLYTLFLRQSPGKRGEDTVFYRRVAEGYHRMIGYIMRHKRLFFIATLLMMPLGCWIAVCLPVSSLPSINKKDRLLLVDWNEPIDAQENLRRTKQLNAVLQPWCKITESETGIRQFLLQQRENTVTTAELYYSCRDHVFRVHADEEAGKWLQARYPDASWQLMDAPDAFTQLFLSETPYFEARFKALSNDRSEIAYAKLEKALLSGGLQFRRGDGMVREPNVSITLDHHMMALYGIDRAAIEDVLRQLFGTLRISELKRFGDVRSIRLKTSRGTLEEKMSSHVTAMNGVEYPLNRFVTLSYNDQQKFITADRSGVYGAITFTEQAIRKADPGSLQRFITTIAAASGYSVDFTGQYFENRQQLHQLWWIFSIVLLLLYFILALQYESLLLPVLVMLTIPLGITGAMLLLWVAGGSLNVMTAIGLVVVLGLIVDDPILKVETLRKLEERYRQEGYTRDDRLLEQMIHEAGSTCLKPLLMVSLTTSIAMAPVLFVGGIGNELQRPLALVIIGGLTLGTFFTTWFIPLAYWYMTKWTKK
jgi:multidrug efflux pump subunit AcrB